MQIIKSKNEKNKFILQGLNLANWITNDCGITFYVINLGTPVSEFQFHPTESSWLIAAQWNRLCKNDEDSCIYLKELYISFDNGKTFKFLEDFIVQFSWFFL